MQEDARNNTINGELDSEFVEKKKRLPYASEKKDARQNA